MQRLDLQLQETANSNKVAIIKIILNTTIQFPSKLANKDSIMPAPQYGADDPRRFSGNSVSEVLDKFRKNYDRIMSLPQETKEEKEFRHCIWLAEKEERERIYQTSIRPFRKATYTPLP